MKIIYVSQVSLPSRSAQSVHVMCLCSAFASLGHETTLIVKNKFWERRPQGFEGDLWNFYGLKQEFRVLRILTLPIHSLHFYRAALNKLPQDPVIVVTRIVPFAYQVTLAGRKAILDLHDARSPRDEALLDRLIHSPFLVRFVVISKALWEHYAGRIPGMPEKMIVAADAVRYEDFASADSSHKEGIAVKKGTARVGYFGSFHPGKGVEMILKVAALCPDIQFVLCGGTADDIGRNLGIRSIPANVEVTGFIPPNKAPEWVRSFDIALLPNQERVLMAGNMDIGQWTSPLKMFEYMASGRPIVASDLPALKEVLRHGQNALLVPQGDAWAWKHAIDRLKKDMPLRNRLGQTAQKEAREKYNWEHRARNILGGLC
ncbi:MAG: glycosyltransferase family 4 protein [Thermodesulfobacteriota bacterium]